MTSEPPRPAHLLPWSIFFALVSTFALAPTPLSAQFSDFLASPFSDTFVVLGNESPLVPEVYYPSNGDGSFGPATPIPDVGVVDGLDVADLDTDGDNDFLLCDGSSGQVLLYTNQGGGLFEPSLVAASITGTSFCTNLRIMDFNDDSRMDFVVGDNRNILGTKVYLQTSPGVFQATAVLDTSWTNVGNNLFGVAAGDVDCDHDSDIVLLGYFGSGAGEVRLYKNDGTGQFTTPTLLFNVNTDFGVTGNTGLALFDLEGDGDLDLVVGGANAGTNSDDAGTHYVYRNDGSGIFAKPTSFSFDVNRQTGIDAYDIEGDGDHDLVIATSGSTSRFLIVENLGNALAPPHEIDTPGSSFLAIGAPALTDDRDGDGVGDCEDQCTQSDLSSTAKVGDCDSGVSNVLLLSGCSVNDLLSNCEVGASNHGEFVACVAGVANHLRVEGIIGNSESGSLQRCAATANIPS